MSVMSPEPAANPGLVVGRSKRGRPIRATVHGSASATNCMLVIAGQHGDEPLARRAARRFARRRADVLAARLNCRLVVVANANPDGASVDLRRTDDGLDMNRDHLRLRTPEVRALHALVRRLQPSLVLDVHTFPRRRRVLRERGLQYWHDVLLDVPTNPALSRNCRRCDPVLPAAAASLSAAGVHCSRYTLFRRDGRVRHSTADLVDARNGIAFRYGVPTVLVEGCEPSRRDPRSAGTRTVRALQLAIEHTIGHANEPSSSPPVTEEFSDPVVIRGRYASPRTGSEFVMADVDTGEPRTVDLGPEYSSDIRPTMLVTPPRAYAVPRSHDRLVELLRDHGFAERSPSSTDIFESLSVVAATPSRTKDRAPKSVELRSYANAGIEPSRFVVFDVDQQGGRALPVMLEPKSKYGLVRYPEFSLTPKTGSPFPVLRVHDAARNPH